MALQPGHERGQSGPHLYPRPHAVPRLLRLASTESNMQRTTIPFRPCGTQPCPRQITWTLGWPRFGSRSPRHSPSGRGRIVRRLLAKPTTELAKTVCAKNRLGAGFSLSPRERVKVRGKDRSTPTACRLSTGLLRVLIALAMLAGARSLFAADK